jgi:hypothetical protein
MKMRSTDESDTDENDKDGNIIEVPQKPQNDYTEKEKRGVTDLIMNLANNDE